jgi:hypothetical protein
MSREAISDNFGTSKKDDESVHRHGKFSKGEKGKCCSDETHCFIPAIAAASHGSGQAAGGFTPHPHVAKMQPLSLPMCPANVCS